MMTTTLKNAGNQKGGFQTGYGFTSNQGSNNKPLQLHQNVVVEFDGNTLDAKIQTTSQDQAVKVLNDAFNAGYAGLNP